MKTRKEKIAELQKAYENDETVAKRDWNNLSNKTLDAMLDVVKFGKEKENENGFRSFL